MTIPQEYTPQEYTPPVPPPPEPTPASGGRREWSRPLLVWGSVIRILGAVFGGISLIILGVWVSNPGAFLDPLNPFAPFQLLGLIIIISGISVMLTGTGWSLQTWARGS